MKKQKALTKTIILLLASSILFASCASTTVLQSIPSGAKVYLNGEPVGTTPYPHTDTKIVGSTTEVKLVKEGYETLYTSFSRDEQVDVGAIVAGVFVYFPFIWVMKYKPTHTYELVPTSTDEKSATKTQTKPGNKKTKVERLRELKQLHDEKLITTEEYEREKAKILNEVDK